MVGMHIFQDDAFRATELTEAVNEIEYLPQFLGSLGLFEEEPIRTRDFAIDRVGRDLQLIPTSSLGEAPRITGSDRRQMETFTTVRLADSFTLYATEIEGIRETGPDGGLLDVQTEYESRARKIVQNMELTHEHHRFGAIQGKLMDADGTTVIYDYFDALEVPEPAVINFKLTNADTKVSTECRQVVRDIQQKSRGSVGANTVIHALAGNDFFDELVGHPSVEKYYLNWQAAQDAKEISAYSGFRHGDIVWHNYRGTDDNSSIAIAPDEVKLCPAGSGVFKKALAPAEFEDFIGTRGVDYYMLQIPDRDRNAFVKGEIYSYPLYLCAKPYCLRSGVIG